MKTQSPLTTPQRTNKSTSIKGITAANPAGKITPHPDQKYIDALLNNDAVVLNQLYAKFSAKIKSMVLQNNGTEAEAADIFQDVLLSLYHKVKNQGFVLTCPFEAFLYLICKNKWINELNKRKTQRIKFTETGKYENISDENFRQAEECGLQEARRELVIEKISALGKSSQELIYLSLNGKSMQETSKILNMSYGYARKKKSEAIAKLISLVRSSPVYHSLE